MKKNVLKTMLATAFAALLAMPFAACSNDPDTPTNEPKNKLHEDPTKVTIQLVECHMHGSWNHVDTQGGTHQNPESKAKYLRSIQEMTYELKEGKGWALADNSQKQFYVIKAADYGTATDPNPAPVYLLFIKYYNIKGELMNQQFVENGQDAIHQHFFSVENVKSLLTGQPATTAVNTTDYIEYKYTDTTPWNETFHSQKAELTGTKNPIGFKGVMRFLQDRVTMDLRIKLYHGYKGKKDPRNGTFSPYHSPSSLLLQQGTWDINFTVPVVVYADREESIAELPTSLNENAIDAYAQSIAENSLSDESNKFVQAIMKAFNLTWSEALADYCRKLYTAGDTESGAIWL